MERSDAELKEDYYKPPEDAEGSQPSFPLGSVGSVDATFRCATSGLDRTSDCIFISDSTLYHILRTKSDACRHGECKIDKWQSIVPIE